MMNRAYPRLLHSCLALAALNACEPAPPVSPHEHAHEHDADDVLVAELRFGEGSTVRFYAGEDGSAAALEEVTSGPAVTSVLDAEPRSIAELYWGLSKEDAPMPEALLRHQLLIAEDDGGPAGFELPRGYLLERLRARALRFDDPNPCTNAVFAANHCDLASYPDGPPCFFNTPGNPSWFTGQTTRLKAGFCLQAGQAASVLSYNHTYSDCLSCRAYHVAWGNNGDPYTATTYRSWTWIGPSGAQKRTWDYETEGVNASTVYDWGIKFQASGSCSEI